MDTDRWSARRLAERLSAETGATLQGRLMSAEGLSSIAKVKRQTVTPGDTRERACVQIETAVYFAGV